MIGVNDSAKPNHLTIFTFFWACQALVHQEYYSYKWLPYDNPMGWLLTSAAILVVLFPLSIPLFCVMLISSIVYNIGIWPYVVNHILLETLINITILFAIAYTYVQDKANPMSDQEFRNSIFEKFSPVILMFVIIMYCFIVNSKANIDFFNLDRSCISDFYIDVTERLDYLRLPNLDVRIDKTPALVSLWIFMIVEVFIPVGLIFKKTRYLAMLVGVPFHMLLAMIGHRTFTGLILALYVMISIDSIAVFVSNIRQWVGEPFLKYLWIVLRLLFSLIVLGLLVLYLMGSSVPPEFFKWSNRYWFFVFAWSAVGGVIYLAILRYYVKGDSVPTEVWSMSPKWIWLMLIPLMVNGFAPFLGFKTETSFTMYSNIKTEGSGEGNHMFVPTINLVKYQEDLVQIIDTDHPQLKKWIERIPLADRTKTVRKLNVVYFELNRVVAETMDQQPDMKFFVTYSRDGGIVQTFRSTDPGAKDSELAQLKSIVLRKLMFYRPVYAGKESYCQH